jgi:hypothetical protein
MPMGPEPILKAYFRAGYPTSFAAPLGDPWFEAQHGGSRTALESFARSDSVQTDHDEDFRRLQARIRAVLQLDLLGP